MAHNARLWVSEDVTQVRLADFGHGAAEWAITESTGRTPHD